MTKICNLSGATKEVILRDILKSVYHCEKNIPTAAAQAEWNFPLKDATEKGTGEVMTQLTFQWNTRSFIFAILENGNFTIWWLRTIKTEK